MLLTFGLLVPMTARWTASAFSATTANTGNTFEAAESFGPSCDHPARNYTVVNGFESGVGLTTGGWEELGTGGGTVTSATDIVRSGNRSMKVDQVYGGDAYLMQMAEPGSTVMVARWAMYFTQRPQDDDELFNVKNGGSMDMKMIFSGTNKLAIEMNKTVNSTTTVTTGNWYVIDLIYNVGSNPHTVNWRINGVAQPTASDTASATTLEDMRWGSSSDDNKYTAYYDDLVISHTAADYPIGDGQVLPLRADGLGTHNTPGNFQNDNNTAIDATTPGRLDDDPLTSNTDYVKQITASGTSYIELTFPDVNQCVDGAQATIAYHASGSSSNGAKTNIVIGGTTTTVLTNMNSTTLKRATKIITPNSPAWTYQDLNDLVARFGYATNVSSRIPYLDAVLIEYHVPADSS